MLSDSIPNPTEMTCKFCGCDMSRVPRIFPLRRFCSRQCANSRRPYILRPEGILPIDQCNGTASIPLGGGKYAIVDMVDVPNVTGIIWALTENGGCEYAVGYGELAPQRGIRMHRLILGTPDDLEVDHIDGNGLNNCRSNLRHVTRSQNLQNTRKRKNKKTSQYRGVSLISGSTLWTAHISIDGKPTSIGRFLTAEDAARAYDEVARIHYGEFGRYNFPEEGEQAA
jgi:hypothetical protein